MPTDITRFTDLLTGFITNRIPREEADELFGLIASDPETYERIMNSDEIRELLESRAHDGRFEVADEISARMKARLMAAVEEQGTAQNPGARVFDLEPSVDDESVRYIAKRGPFRYMTAASVVVLLGLTSYFLFFRNNVRVTSQIIALKKSTDIAPGTNKAILTLANGSKIILDSAQNGLLAQQGNSDVVKTDSGQLAYKISGLPKNSSTNQNQIAAVSLNTLSTPKGGQFQLKLPDGTKVWLNAASSITYPTAFSGKERNVSITGEAYFEVAYNDKQPFSVTVNNMTVRDIGTHFNINAYEDESAMKTTLLEGSVKVTNTKNNQSFTIRPGEQTELKENKLSINNHVNLDETIAWKDGSFHFESADLQTILRQFARWYNVEVVYEGMPTNRKFFGIVKRSNSLSRVLEMLKDNNIEYVIEGNKLIVKSS